MCTISSLVCVLAFTYASYTCGVWHVHVQYAVETAHGIPDVICTVCQQYEVKQTSAFDIFDEYNILSTR